MQNRASAPKEVSHPMSAIDRVVLIDMDGVIAEFDRAVLDRLPPQIAHDRVISIPGRCRRHAKAVDPLSRRAR